MKNRTKEEITSKVNEIWDYIEELDVTVYEDKVEIEMSNMFDPPGMSFTQLKSLSDFFETENIDDKDHFSIGGCETCDYGSKYGFTLVIK